MHERTPFQDYQRAQRRMVWAGRLAWFIGGLILLGIVTGKIGQ